MSEHPSNAPLADGTDQPVVGSDTPRTDAALINGLNSLADLHKLCCTMERELARARATNQRLQRRCHAAEGIVAKARLVEGRPQGDQGRSFGRALANYAAAMYLRERDEARAKLREVADWLASRNEFERAAEIYALLKGSDTANAERIGAAPAGASCSAGPQANQ